MSISMSRVEYGPRDIMGKTLGDAIAVADGAVSAALTGGLYRIKAVTACKVRIGTGLSAGGATAGEPWSLGDVAPRYINTGDVVAVDAA